MYFLLGGRVLAASFLKSVLSIPKAPVHADEDESEKVLTPRKPSGPRWLSLSSSLFRRSIRLALPAIAVGFIQWQVCLGGLVNASMAANSVLSPASLWVPTWCGIGNFGGFLQFSLDLFTERNHQYILTVGSALWTTYDQFWGSVLVYIVAAALAPLPHRGRYTVFTIICTALWWTNSPNLLYVAPRRPCRTDVASYILGLWLADLHAAGFVRKIQDNWKLTVAIEVCAMALALAFIAGGTKVASPANILIARFTVYDGKFGWDPSLVWPQYMLTSNWCVLSSLVWD